MKSQLNHIGTHLLLGKVKGSGSPVWYLINELTRHGLILGSTGSGKTNLIFWIVSQLLSRVSVWLFDFKEDFRHLLKLFPDKLLVFDLMNNFIFNPLSVPPYVKPNKWIELFCEVFCSTNNLLDGSKSMLKLVIAGLYQKFGVYNYSNKFPCVFDVTETLQNLKISFRSREAGFRDSLLNRLNAYLINAKMYDCSIGFDLEKLSAKSVVFELGGMAKEQANFWINILLYWLFSYRIAKKERGKLLLNLVVFDEAKAVFSPFENVTIGFAPITYMTSMLREFGVGILAADQTAQLNNIIFANSQLKILFPLGSGQDLLKAGGALGLTNEQASYVYHLNMGEAIVRYPKIPEPFILQIPKYPLE